MGAKRLDLFHRVILPATVPAIMTGIRLGATFAILMLVVAEYVGAKAGIGALVINSQYAFQIPQMYAAILLLALLGVSTNLVLVRVQKRATRWKER
jgi:sulfonate transport system permease protein